MTTNLAGPLPEPAARSAFSFIKVTVVVLLGTFLWFVGIFLIRCVGSLGALGNQFTPVVFGLIVVGTIPFVWLAPKLVGLRPAYRLHCGAIMGATAALLDACAVRWTDWYAVEPRVLADSAATLLWAIGVVVALGLAMSVAEEPIV